MFIHPLSSSSLVEEEAEEVVVVLDMAGRRHLGAVVVEEAVLVFLGQAELEKWPQRRLPPRVNKGSFSMGSLIVKHNSMFTIPAFLMLPPG